MATFFLQTFGCRANQADSVALAAHLAAAGWTEAPGPEAADWVVLNTCTVTAEADAECQRTVRRLRRHHPGIRILAAGCYVERAAGEVAALPGVERILRRSDWVPLQVLAGAERTRPIVKVQDGCDRRCSFCIVPSVRGVSRSLPEAAVVAAVEAEHAAGHPEVVLSGINLGQWGRDLPAAPNLGGLVAAVLARTGVRRLRLSSVEPMDWTPALTDLLAHPRLARHAHLPLQSGSERVLARMRRRYRARDYAARVEALASRVAGVAIGADVMVGFPGESESDFRETVSLIAALPLAYAHIFPYSPRPGTAAAAWTPVPSPVITERAARLRQLMAGKRQAFVAAQAGQPVSVVTLRGGWGLSDNYLRLPLPAGTRPNQLMELTIPAEAQCAA